jgi:TRAP-type C4-dicarboxylate transport system permease small subunit
LWILASFIFLGVRQFGRAQRVHSKFRHILELVILLGSLRLIDMAPVGYIWSLEFSMILLLWVGILGASLATYEKRHISVDAFRRLIPAKFHNKLDAVSGFICGVFCAFLFGVACVYLFGDNGEFYNKSNFQATDMPKWTASLSMVVGFGIMAVRFLSYSITDFSKKYDPDAAQEVRTH